MLIQLTDPISDNGLDGGNYTHAKVTKMRAEFEEPGWMSAMVIAGRLVDGAWVPAKVFSPGNAWQINIRVSDFSTLSATAMQAGNFGDILERGLLQWAIDHNGPQGTIV